jgi:hypothetical protein
MRRGSREHVAGEQLREESARAYGQSDDRQTHPRLSGQNKRGLVRKAVTSVFTEVVLKDRLPCIKLRIPSIGILNYCFDCQRSSM